MEKFLVLYRAPNAVIDEWMKKPEQERKPEETKMMDAWKKWMAANASKFADKGAGAGKPKVVSSWGVKDARNDIMMYQIVQANYALGYRVDRPVRCPQPPAQAFEAPELARV